MNPSNRREEKTAWIWIIIGLGLQLISNFASRDFGWILRSCGTITLLMACALYAQTKGRSRNWGLLGFLSLLGVIAVGANGKSGQRPPWPDSASEHASPGDSPAARLRRPRPASSFPFSLPLTQPTFRSFALINVSNSEPVLLLHHRSDGDISIESTWGHFHRVGTLRFSAAFLRVDVLVICGLHRANG